MPRSNRPRRREASVDADDDASFGHLVAGWRRTEQRRGASWNVQPVSGMQAVKTYVCPGCGGDVEPGTAHLVTWRADGILGDEADLAARRHWHSRCWAIG